MTPEGKVKAKVKRRLKELGVYQFWPVQTGYGARTLDCLFCYNGVFFAIETKRKGETYTPLQVSTKEAIEAAGGFVFLVDDDQSLDMAIRTARRRV